MLPLICLLVNIGVGACAFLAGIYCWGYEGTPPLALQTSLASLLLLCCFNGFCLGQILEIIQNMTPKTHSTKFGMTVTCNKDGVFTFEQEKKK